MPYTLSHVAVVLPFARALARARLLSAAVIGSMVPDFGYLMPLHPARAATHSAWSLLTFSLPVGLATYWVFQYLIKPPLITVLPDAAFLRWRPWSKPAALTDPRQWLLAACGVLAGAITHLVWDGFTHEGARGLRMVPELDDWGIVVHGHYMTGANVLQGWSSVLGLAFVLAGVLYALRDGAPQGPVPVRPLGPAARSTWMLAYLMAAVLFTFGFDLHDPISHLPFPGVQILVAAVALLRGLALSLVAVSLALTLYLRVPR
ncbi:MAG TPA: DUF4184 family protein [Steroidobacteraceae bacterium]|nr:DUF4184 family protein [Steroidobacteraceae bacterium]